MPTISVIIPNYNGEKFLPDCLNSLKKQSFTDFEVILVDNGSTDDSVAVAKSIYPDIRVIRLKGNTGFAHAVNEGIKVSEGEYVILLNNDTEVFYGFVNNQYRLIKDRTDVFSCSALMIQKNNKALVDNTGDEFCALGWGFAPYRDRSVKECTAVREIFSSCAGAAIYRKSVFKEIGLFDERFFAYLEDVDIGYRARIIGYRNIYNPYAKVYHIGSASSGSRHNAFKVELSARNSMYLIRKNMPLWQIALNAPTIAVGIVIKTVYFAKKGLAGAYIKGIAAGLRNPLRRDKDGIISRDVCRVMHNGGQNVMCHVKRNCGQNIICRNGYDGVQNSICPVRYRGLHCILDRWINLCKIQFMLWVGVIKRMSGLYR